ncbi:MAG: AlpA family transcriptional regulator [Betaproteobacteria bacterium]|nr:AlpA family transcriptional regulator [Betaproteobacteria bacterium]
MNKQTYQTPAILRRREVLRRTGLSNSALYQRIKNGEFPRSFSIGGQLVGWLESDVDGWIAGCVSSRRKASVTGGCNNE